MGVSVSIFSAVLVGAAKGLQGEADRDMGLGSKEPWLLHAT